MTELNKNTLAGFVPIRRGIYEHLNDGRMTGKEWMVYTALHLKADHLTGICYKVSGVALGVLLNESTNYINRIMRSLETKGYIKRLSHRGQIKYYPVVINKYLTSNGILIDAHNTKSLKEIAWYVEDDCTLTAFQQHFNCTSFALQLHNLQYIKEVKILKRHKQSTPRSSSNNFNEKSPNNKRFDQFWIAYPKKAGKVVARRAFEKIKPSEELLQKILNAVEEQSISEQWLKEGGRYIPNPATWLNQERWDDELKVKETNGTKKTPREFAKTSEIGETIEA